MTEYDLPTLSVDEDGNVRHGGALTYVGDGDDNGERREDTTVLRIEEAPENGTLQVLAKYKCGLTLAEWHAETGLNRQTFWRHRKALEAAERIIEKKGKWRVTS